MTYGKPIGAVRGEKGCRAAALSSKTRIKKKSTDFVDMMVSKTIQDFHLSLNQPQNSADGRYIVILKNITKSHEHLNVSLFPLFLVVPVT